MGKLLKRSGFRKVWRVYECVDHAVSIWDRIRQITLAGWFTIGASSVGAAKVADFWGWLDIVWGPALLVGGLVGAFILTRQPRVMVRGPASEVWVPASVLTSELAHSPLVAKEMTEQEQMSVINVLFRRFAADRPEAYRQDGSEEPRVERTAFRAWYDVLVLQQTGLSQILDEAKGRAE